MIGRRTLLAAFAGTLATRGMATAPDSIGAALDAASSMPPAEGLRHLARFDPRKLPAARRLDLVTARAGLAIDVALAARPQDFALHLGRTLGTVAPDVAEARITLELTRLHARANREFARIGIGGGTTGARFETLFADRHFAYPDSDAGRDAAVADMNRTLTIMRRRARREINAPPFAFDADARPLSAADIAAGKGGYRLVPTPGRPGAYIVDLKDIARRPRWSLPSVVAHELVPGHMIQLGIEAVAPPHPLRLTYASAFVEGWGIYAETLAAEWGLFADPRAMLGHVHWLIFRVARAKVDLNIHRHGWSIERARGALAKWQGVPAYFAPFDSDLARIAKEPGTRTAEAMAWLAIADRAPRLATLRPAFARAVLAYGRKRIEDLP